MFICFSASALNIRAATPACDFIPTPTTETLLISFTNSISPPPKVLTKSFKIFAALSECSFFTVKVKSVNLSDPTFWTITSISIPASLIGDKIFAAIPGVSGTFLKINFESSSVHVIPEITALS